jgi:hypothetical protein
MAVSSTGASFTGRSIVWPLGGNLASPIGATMTPVPRPTDLDRGVLVDLYKKGGLGMPQVAADLGVSQTVVRARMVELGIPSGSGAPDRGGVARTGRPRRS